MWCDCHIPNVAVIDDHVVIMVDLVMSLFQAMLSVTQKKLIVLVVNLHSQQQKSVVLDLVYHTTVTGVVKYAFVSIAKYYVYNYVFGYNM